MHASTQSSYYVAKYLLLPVIGGTLRYLMKKFIVIHFGEFEWIRELDALISFNLLPFQGKYHLDNYE